MSAKFAAGWVAIYYALHCAYLIMPGVTLPRFVFAFALSFTTLFGIGVFGTVINTGPTWRIASTATVVFAFALVVMWLTLPFDESPLSQWHIGSRLVLQILAPLAFAGVLLWARELTDATRGILFFGAAWGLITPIELIVCGSLPVSFEPGIAACKVAIGEWYVNISLAIGISALFVMARTARNDTR